VNYMSLKQTLANHFVSTEVVPFLPVAIEMAEASFNRRIRTREMVERAYFNLAPDDEYIQLPDDFLEARSLYITSSGYTTRLEYLSIESMQRKKIEDATADRPRFFSVVGQELELYPSPGDYDLDMVYYQRIPALSDSSSTNWLLAAHPDVYLYGTLLQAAPYMYQDKRVQMWSAAYEAALEALRISDERAEFSGGVLKASASPL